MDPTSLYQAGIQILVWSPLAFAAAFIVVALMRGWLVLGTSYQEKCQTAEAWRALYEKSQETLAETQQSAFIDRQRGDAAIDSARVANRLLEALHASGGGHVPSA